MLQASLNKAKYIGAKVFWGNFKLSFFLAFKSIVKGNKWALVLLILVMSFSFTNLIFVSSLISGVMTTLDNQMITTMFGNVLISPKENKYYIEKCSRLENRIEQLSGVAAVAPHLNYSAFIEYKWKDKLSQYDKGKSGNWEVIGIDPQKEKAVTSLHKQLIKGSYLNEYDRDSILLGVEIAGGEESRSSDFLTLGGIDIGDKVRLTYPNGVQREYKVKGIFYAREMIRADKLAFVTLDEMASVLGRDLFYDRASEILIKAEVGVDELSLVDTIKANGLKEEVRSWREYGGALSSVASSFEVIGSLIGSVGLIISAAVMFIIIYINVLNRKRQIGIMRAIGIPNIALTGSYIVQALFYAIAGIIIGWLMVTFLLEPFFQFFPLDLPIGFVSLTVRSLSITGAALGLTIAGMIAGLIPAWTIMRQSIINIIWGT